MTAVSRASFLARLRYGVDLTHPALARGLDQAGVPGSLFAEADTDRDGVLRGAELRQAFREIDRFDVNGDRLTFSDGGRAGELYRALLAGRREGPYHGVAIARAARGLARARGEEYALASAPRSPNARISGNRRPGQTRLVWLAGRWKCNQFVGDVLHRAGLEMPTYKMPDGSQHYLNAEALPSCRPYFDRIYSLEDLRLGDVMVIDLPGRGAATAHVEIVTHLDPKSGTMRATGAHLDGAYETERSLLFGTTWREALFRARPAGASGCWELDGKRIILLRPKRTRRK